MRRAGDENSLLMVNHCDSTGKITRFSHNRQIFAVFFRLSLNFCAFFYYLCTTKTTDLFMNKILIAAAASLLASCAPKAGYHFHTPALDNDNGKMAYITNYDTGRKIDSLVVADSAIVFKGIVSEPVVARLIIDGQRRGTFILENGDISLNSDNRRPAGTPLNDRLARLFAETDSVESLITAYTDSARQDDKFNSRVNQLNATYRQLFLDAYHENLGNALGYYCFYQLSFDMTRQEIIEEVEYNQMLKRYCRVGDLLASFSKLDATAPGKRMTDFSVAEGDSTVSLSDFVGHGNYTLVDFWASWCGPCIREIEVVKDIHKKYAGKGLDVVGVAVWDEPQSTIDAIEAHQIPWRQIINTKKAATDIYGILSIPHLILFDPNGTIVARGMTGDSLRAVVDREVAKWQPAKNEELEVRNEK